MCETFPWTLAHETATGKDGTVRWSHGMVPFFGGRSTVWSAWCPVPTRDEMEGWPDVTYEAAMQQMGAAIDLLNVQSASEIDANRSKEDLIACNSIRPVYSTLLQVGAPITVPHIGSSLFPRFLGPVVYDSNFVLTFQSHMGNSTVRSPPNWPVRSQLILWRDIRHTTSLRKNGFNYRVHMCCVSCPYPPRTCTFFASFLHHR